MIDKNTVREIIEDFRRESHKPRLVCTCDNFTPSENNIGLDIVRCGNCGGWMTATRKLELGL